MSDPNNHILCLFMVWFSKLKTLQKAWNVLYLIEYESIQHWLIKNDEYTVHWVQSWITAFTFHKRFIQSPGQGHSPKKRGENAIGIEHNHY